MGSLQRTLRLLAPTASQLARSGQTARGLAAATGDLLKTELWDFHVQQGAKMVDFTGWSMPLQYKDSVIDSVNNVRSNAGIFDVSHMCGHVMKGPDAVRFLETLVVADVKSLPPGKSTLTVFTNENGGIIDDSVITRVSDDELYIVTNAGCREKDIAHISKQLEGFKSTGGQVDWRVYDERSLLAIQGPIAAEVLQKMVKIDLSKIYFSDFVETDVKGVPCFITRTGYTGEDGFEISIPTEKVVELATAFIEDSRVKMAGLGARDALRLEAGLCLYGNDLDESISPVEGGLTWTVAKSRRETGGFLGADVILKQIKDGVTKRRVGLVSDGAPARSHSKILDPNTGNEIGEVTSGAFSPSLKKNIAMGYVTKEFAKSGTPIQVQVRAKTNSAEVTKMPFVPAKYYKGA